MAESAAHLVDHVLPEVPVRQWVLSLPHVIRFLLVRDPALLRLARGIFVRAVQSFYTRRAKAEGHPNGRAGAVVCVQRFDSALRLDVHFHALLLDGVYTGFGSGESLTFHKAQPLRDTEVVGLVRHIHALIFGKLQRLGHLNEHAQLDPDLATALDPLGTQHAAAIQGLIPFGARAGHPTAMLEQPPQPSRPAAKKKLCADHLGFSLHAAVRIGADKRARLERLCRYITRPPLAQERLSLTRTSDVVYRFRHPWRNGKTAVVLDPLTFLSRLAAQVPPPRRHSLTYHGVLAPAASKRELIVPGHDQADGEGRCCPGKQTLDPPLGDSSAEGAPERARPERYSWATLMRRSFLIDVLACPCGARRRVLSLVCDPAQIARVLTHLGLPTDPPERAPPRATQRTMEFG